jgi:hypothetical protein
MAFGAVLADGTLKLDPGEGPQQLAKNACRAYHSLVLPFAVAHGVRIAEL